MKRSVTIREFQKEDLDTVLELIHRVVDTSYKDAYPAGALKLYKRYHSRENILADATNGYCVVAENDDGIVGTGTILDDNIRRVYVSPDRQQAGTGRLIYEALEQWALDQKLPRLELSASLVAQRFWELQGFHFEKEESIPTPDKEELKFYLMSKQLG